ncbi:MAG: hypothetical protein K9H26_02670 [Prolixibacteraceae bacterium]|nr:hypothetical protein [Prolixibacteraceae bacterium]
MKKSLTICILIISTVLITETVHAQQYSIKERWNIKTNYDFYPNLGVTTLNSVEFSPVFGIEANYGLLNFLEVGLYSGYTRVRGIIFTSVSENRAIGTGHNAPVLFYGATANVHLFPFFFKREKFRIDCYLSGKFGGFYIYAEERGDYRVPERGNRFDYGVYGGLAIYIGEHWGIYGEYGYGNYCNSRVGLTFKF